MIVVFDIDGTLSNPENRIHHILGENKDWVKFLSSSGSDSVIEPIAEMFSRCESAGDLILFVTGRDEKYREDTVEWLNSKITHIEITKDNLIMRPRGDRRHDYEIKEEWLLSLDPEDWPDLIFEDRASVVEMWRRHGIRTCQVDVGDF